VISIHFSGFKVKKKRNPTASFTLQQLKNGDIFQFVNPEPLFNVSINSLNKSRYIVFED